MGSKCPAYGLVLGCRCRHCTGKCLCHQRPSEAVANRDLLRTTAEPSPESDSPGGAVSGAPEAPSAEGAA